MSIVKLADDLYSRHYDAQRAYDSMMAPAMASTTGPYGKSALIGLGAGSLLGLLAHKPITGAIIGGLGGTAVGLGIASAIHNGRAHEKAAIDDPQYGNKVNELHAISRYLDNQAREDEHRREQVRSFYRER